MISQIPVFELQKKWLLAVYDAYFHFSTEQKSSSNKQSKFTIEFYISFLFHYLQYNSEWQNEIEIVYKQRETFARYRNYKPTGFTLPNFTLQSLLETMKPNRILQLVTYLLLEKKILLVQKNYSDNAIIIESLLTLLSPLYPLTLPY